METVTFVDGFGRAVQVKKDGVVTSASKGNSAKDENVMIVSGRNMYDAFGRVAKSFYPTTEGTGSKSTFSKSFDNVSPTVTVYDVLDRATSVTLPDNSTTTTAYTVDNGSHALVTTVTDALHNVQATHTNGSGKTVKSIQHSGPDGEITTTFEYDGIQRLVRVTDTEGNVTTSVYDMGDRRTEVSHPASGITSFTYDPLGNVLTKQTANMAEEGKMITYTYDYHRLTGISYPDHPENNVKYYYGGRNASHNRIGRLMMREDGTGAIEYFYGKMGEVTKTRRTLIVPNQAIATYVTQWTYDSHNRLLEMIYPDEEKVTYSYNLGGLLEKVRGEKSYGYDYITKLGYDKFEQRSYLKYCNGAETFYTYDDRRRLSNLAVNSGNKTIMDNDYTFDAVSNVLSVANNASLPASGNAGGRMSHAYTYDGLYRLVSATGTYTGADSKSASYTLAMGYDNMHRIKSKSQHLTQDNVQFNGTLNVGYDLSYTYGTEAGKKFQLASVKDVNYRTEETPGDNNIENNHVYLYDKNGNLVYVNTGRMMKDGHNEVGTRERKLIWDEENRLLASDDNGFVTNYWYDADGERTVKTSGESDQVYVNSEFAGGRTNTAKFSLYVSPYLVANQGGRYTKHIYIGSQRVVSKIGDFDSYGSDPRRIQYAGSETDGLSVDYKGKYTQQLQVIKDNYATFAVPYNGEDNNDYVDGKGFCCNDGSLEAAQARVMARAAKNNFQEGDAYEKMQFYYHPDHLGSSSYITNLDGEVVQHIEYVPFGEVFVEERNNIWNTPYLFNAKEFDEETGLYYYGARYYEPKLSQFLSVDRYSENYPNFSPYSYVGNNPIKYIDVNGDSIVINNRGYVNYYNSNDPDTRVFLNNRCIGSLGSTINANGWFDNLLSDNAKESDDLFSPLTFKNYVQQYGKWDYKYRSPANKNSETRSMKYHILGIAFYRKDKSKGLGDLPETYFLFRNNPKARAEDLNNFHFGVVGKSFWMFSEEFMLKTAGAVEMQKWAEDYKYGKRPTPYVPESWRPIIVTGYYPSVMGGGPIYEIGWPYGDNPKDSRWIIRGFNYYKSHMK